MHCFVGLVLLGFVDVTVKSATGGVHGPEAVPVTKTKASTLAEPQV